MTDVYKMTEAAVPERSGLYLHVEMGVTWRPRKRSPKNHKITYMSKGARELLEARERTASAMALLPTEQYQHNMYHEALTTQRPMYQEPPAAVAYMPYSSTAAAAPPPLGLPSTGPMPHYQIPERRKAPKVRRSRSGSFHERGHSAPGLISAPWMAEPEPMAASALPQRRGRPQVMKELPPTPSKYRICEEDLPWTSTGAYALDFASNAADGFSGYSHDDEDEQGVMEMESLAAAMMTIDNGFEDQWWYQGSRMVNVAGDLITPTTVASRCAPHGTINWPVAKEESHGMVHTREVSSSSNNPMDIVSPLSEYSDTMNTMNFMALKRSITLNSERII